MKLQRHFYNYWLQVCNYYRYFTNAKPKETKKGEKPSYVTYFRSKENFDENWYSSRKWGRLHPSGDEVFYNAEENVKPTPRGLKLLLSKNNRTTFINGEEYTTDWDNGNIESKFNAGYGYTEVEVVMEKHNRAWDAYLWLMSEWLEIDCMEIYTENGKTKINSNIHYGNYGKDHKVIMPRSHPIRKPFGRPVKFGIETTPSNVKFYYDGHLVREWDTPVPKEMSVNIGIGASKGNDIEEAMATIKYFKYWKRKEDDK